MDGGAYIDRVVYYQDDAPGPVNANLATGVASGWGSDPLAHIENLVGTSFGDVLVGDDHANVLDGAPAGQFEGSDTIIGNGGDDQLSDSIFGDDRSTGGRGNDRLALGIGDDMARGGTGVHLLSYPYSDAYGQVLGVNIDLVSGLSTGQGIDSVSGIENLIGTYADDTLRGNSQPNVLEGSPFSDRQHLSVPTPSFL